MQRWLDETIQWDPNVYNTTSVVLPAKLLWKPEVLIQNRLIYSPSIMILICLYRLCLSRNSNVITTKLNIYFAYLIKV